MALKDAILAPLLKVGLKSISRTRLPKIKGKIHLKGLNAPVEVLRDRWGVPHIYGQSIEDALFAQGFVHAQERMWQMDFNRRLVSGRLAEVLGEVGLPADRAMRTLGLRRAAEKDAELLPEELRDLFGTYCAGVNAWLEHGSLPVEFMLLRYQPEPWSLVDILSWAKLMSWSLCGNWDTEYQRGRLVTLLGAERVAELEIGASESWPVILDAAKVSSELENARRFTGPGASEGAGSNNWVVSGVRSAKGQPLLANDMHLGLTAPAIWFENHLVGGDIDVSGISLPGVPLIIAGHNGKVAWGFTDGFPDVQDLYEEHLRSTADGLWEYEYRGEWFPVEIRREEILVKGGDTVIEQVKLTRHGPIVNYILGAKEDEPSYALRWTTLEPETTTKAIYHMNLAKDCLEFYEALRWFTSPSQNTVYADTQGNIAYTLFGRVPIRSRGDGSVPVPGWSGEYEWSGNIPFEEMPHLVNPPLGYIATANNRVARSDYPYFLSNDYVYGDRAERIIEMIESKSKVYKAFFRQMQFDLISPTARDLARAIGGLKGVEPDLEEVVTLMGAWDGTLAVESAEAALYEVLIRKILEIIAAAHLGELAEKFRGKPPAAGLWSMHSWEWLRKLLRKPDSPWFNLGHGEKRDNVLSLALRRSIDFLSEQVGPEVGDWKWGKFHQLTFRHILGAMPTLASTFNRGPYPIGGDGSTVWSTFASEFDLSHETITGPAFRFIADLSDLNHCLGLLAPGNSGHIASPHYDDGVKAWFDEGYHPMLRRKEEIEQELEGTLKLVPLE